MRKALAGALLATLGLLVGCSSAEQAPFRPPIDQAGDLGNSGHDLYLRDCAWCHGADAAGTKYGGEATDIRDEGPAAFDFVLSTGRMPMRSPDDQMDRGDRVFTQAQIEAIVEYSRSLTIGPEVPEVDLAAGDLAEGETLYQDNCAQCHSATGTGAVLTKGREIPDLYQVDSVEIAEAMLTGPGDMPVFGRDTFTTEHRDSLVRYVVELKGNNRGGWAIGRLGPVSEGLVAWIIGLLSLVVVIRLIGTRADE